MSTARSTTSREMAPAKKQQLLLKLYEVSVRGVIPRGRIAELANEYGCSSRTVARIWKMRATGNVSTLRKGRCGRKVLFHENEVNERIAAAPLCQRQTLRDTGEATGIAKSTLARYLKINVFKRSNTTLRPILTDANKAQRLDFCHLFLNPRHGRFRPMMNIFHIDEKWFNMEKNRRKFYLAKDEEAPKRKAKSKKWIPKLMFLAAVARPRFDTHYKKFYDGKIGIWPFATEVPAKRSSRNRPRGTLEIKSMNVDGKAYRSMLVDNLFPAIKANVPLHRGKTWYIQHDNATPHTSSSAMHDILNEVNVDGWNFQMFPQPPNSPDLNCLDLGFFNSIQALQYKTFSRSLQELIDVTTAAYDQLPDTKINNVFL